MEGPICYIVGAGTFYEEGFAPERGDFVIAADGGYQILLERGVTMDLVVGDFDSIGFRPDHPNVVDLPVEKDDTDMMAAIRLGRERGFRSFCLYGGTGGRVDHTLANLQSLVWLSRRGCQGALIGDGWTAGRSPMGCGASVPSIGDSSLYFAWGTERRGSGCGGSNIRWRARRLPVISPWA